MHNFFLIVCLTCPSNSSVCPPSALSKSFLASPHRSAPTFIKEKRECGTSPFYGDYTATFYEQIYDNRTKYLTAAILIFYLSGKTKKQKDIFSQVAMKYSRYIWEFYDVCINHMYLFMRILICHKVCFQQQPHSYLLATPHYSFIKLKTGTFLKIHALQQKKRKKNSYH